MTTTSSQQKMRRAMVRHTVRTAGPGILTILLMLAVLVGIFVVPSWYVTQDLQGSALRQDVGAVTGFYCSNNRDRSYYTVLLEVNGIRTQIQAPTSFQVGQQVQVTYRVGKSGQIYAQDITALPAK